MSPNLVGVLAIMCLIMWPAQGQACEQAKDRLVVASFNVKWIGYYEQERKNEALADLLKDCDVLLVQELVAPPDVAAIGLPVNWPPEREAKTPDGKDVRPAKASTEFFQAMRKHGFQYVLSPEDTGPGDRQFLNNARTEWFVAFYKADRVCTPWDGGVCSTLPGGGFLALDRTASPTYDRVPFAFPFRALDMAAPGMALTDFVLVSVHLRPGSGPQARARRRHELAAIDAWATRLQDAGENDVFVVGDMNLQGCAELGDALPPTWASLNDQCLDTVPSKENRPYDHVMYRPTMTGEVDTQFDFRVIDLVKRMEIRWPEIGLGSYPGKPYRSRDFPKHFSDHNPVHFRILVKPDDDGPTN